MTELHDRKHATEVPAVQTHPAGRPGLRDRRGAQLALWGLAGGFGRLPVSMTLTVFVLATADTGRPDGFGQQIAGAAAMALGCGALFWGEALDRAGAGRVLIVVNLVVAPILLLEIGGFASGGALWVLFALVVIQGAMQGSMPSGYRALVPRLATGAMASRLTTFDVVIGEFVYIVGPVLVSILAIFTSFPVVLVVMAIFAALSAGLLMQLPARVRSGSRSGPKMRSSRIGRHLLPVVPVSVMLGIAVGLIQAGTVTRTTEPGGWQGGVGVLNGLLALGSSVGGLLVALRPTGILWDRLLRLPVLLLAMSALCFAAAVVPRMWGFAAIVFLAGFPIAPVLARVSCYILSRVPEVNLARILGIQSGVYLLSAGIGNYVGGMFEGLGAGSVLVLAVAGLAAVGGMTVSLIARIEDLGGEPAVDELADGSGKAK